MIITIFFEYSNLDYNFILILSLSSSVSRILLFVIFRMTFEQQNQQIEIKHDEHKLKRRIDVHCGQSRQAIVSIHVNEIAFVVQSGECKPHARHPHHYASDFCQIYAFGFDRQLLASDHPSAASHSCRVSTQSAPPPTCAAIHQPILFVRLRIDRLAFVVIYTLEFLFNIVAKGFVAKPFTYLRSNWHRLDLLILIIA